MPPNIEIENAKTIYSISNTNGNDKYTNDISPPKKSVNNDLNNNASVLSTVGVENVPRRAPLVRAMSAPIRPIDESKLNLQIKRKVRKKKMSARYLILNH